MVAFRRYTLLPLDDCLYALQPTIPHLTRSSLHRCLQRHGPHLGNVDVEVTARVALELLLRRLVAFDIPAGGRLHEKATTAISRDFLLRLIAAVPYKIHTVPRRRRVGSAADQGGDRKRRTLLGHAFELACARNDIEHRTTKAKHPWTIKDATVKRFYYEKHDQLRRHLADFIAAYNSAEDSRPSRVSHPTSSSVSHGPLSPSASTLNPLHQMPGRNI